MCAYTCVHVCEWWCVSLTLISSFKTEHFMACFFSLHPSPPSTRLLPPPPPAPFPLLAWTVRHGNSHRCISCFSCTASWMADLIKSCFNPQLCGGGDSSVVRAPDSWLKGRGFESLLERRENFLLQGRLSVLTLISVSVPPPCYHSST